MKTHMRYSRTIFIVFLVGLFLSLSFNAYACLIPIYGGVKVTQGSDCTTPGEEPATQFCDGFKTLAVKSGPDAISLPFSHVVLVWDLSPFSPDPVQTAECLSACKTGDLIFPKKLLPLLSVFRN